MLVFALLTKITFVGLSIKNVLFSYFLINSHLFWKIHLTFYRNSVHFLDEPTITLDQSTLLQIPSHLKKLINDLRSKSPTQFDVMNTAIVACALETGFIGDWCCCEDVDGALKGYMLNWSYSFDRRFIIDFAKMSPTLPFRFRFSLKHDAEIIVQSLDLGDSILITVYLIDNYVMTPARSLTLPMSRYVVNKKLNLKNLPGNFRNLRELSIKLKNEIFLPHRNDIYCVSSCKVPYPSLPGLPETLLLMLFRYLKPKDIASLSTTCKSIRDISVPFLLRNKSKKD